MGAGRAMPAARSMTPKPNPLAVRVQCTRTPEPNFNMNQNYNPDPAHPPSMTPHDVAMQMRAVEKACEQQYHVSNLAMTVALEIWRYRETSVRRIACVLQETLVRRVSDCEANLAEMTDRWARTRVAAGAFDEMTVNEVMEAIITARRAFSAKERSRQEKSGDVKDQALAILRRSSVSDFPDDCEYARWVRCVASAAADGNDKWLERLEDEFCKHIAKTARERSERAETQTHNSRI
jgi:hypothetical protein